MDIEFVAPDSPTDALTAIAVVTFEDGTLSSAAEALDEATGGSVSKAIGASRYSGKLGQTLDLPAPHGVEAGRIILAGAGKKEDFQAGDAAETALAHAYQAAKNTGATTLAIRLPGAPPAVSAQAAFGVRIAAWRFDRHRTTLTDDKKPSVTKVSVAVDDPGAAVDAFAPWSALADGMIFARDLVMEPANILYPAEFARRVQALERLGLAVEILGEREMADLGMGSLLGVGQGSRRESQLAVIQWKGAADPNAQPVAFVGKGVCFDTGGISLKPPEGMEEMVTDMGGAAAVSGLMHVLASRKAKVNAVGILGLVENMPDGNAQRPGDVVKSMSGQTIEVINTDAEGRLVLADAIWYCQDRFKPKFMVDLATLTGAIIVALGKDYAGMFSNNDELAANLLAASKATGENLWRMPLPPQYEKNIDSPVADMKNVGPRHGGSITAALFIQRFVNKLPWAHLDIASTAHQPTSLRPTHPAGATGFGVRLLNRLVADNYEG
ncbi:MAG: leucyl aminopeptidase [Caulobacteraceae bacterium]